MPDTGGESPSKLPFACLCSSSTFSRTSTVTDSDPAAHLRFAVSKDTEINAVVGGKRYGFDDGGRNNGEEK